MISPISNARSVSAPSSISSSASTFGVINRRGIALVLKARDFLLEFINLTAWDNANTHEDDEVEAAVRDAAGRLVLLYLPTYSPWLNPIEMLWRHFRREVTHCELFPTVKALLAATREFFDLYNQQPHWILSVIGSHAQKVI